MPTSEDKPERQTGSGGEPLNPRLAQGPNDFEYRLNHAEWKAVRRTGIWVAMLVATGLGLFLYSVREAQNAKTEAERSKEVASDYDEQAHKDQAQIKDLKAALSNSREAVQYVSQGINLYHAGNYAAAVEAYEDALRLDPGNPYVLNLKGYSMFKKKDFTGAASTLRESTVAQPQYAWGYFDLARVYCAERMYDLAKKSIEEALRLRPGLRATMSGDGEFLRLCAPIKQTFSQPAPPPNKPSDGTAKVPPPLPRTLDTGTESYAPPPNEVKSGCHVSIKLRRSGEIPPDLQRSVEDALLDKVCDLAASNFNIAEASITFKMTFEIREDGSVASDSIDSSGGSGQFDAAVRKAVGEERFPQLAGPYKVGTTVQVGLEMSYSTKHT